MRIHLSSLGLLMLLACGEDASDPADSPSDAASEPDAGEASDASETADTRDESDAGDESDAEEARDAGEANDADPGEGSPRIELSGALTETLENTPPALTLSKSTDQSSLLHLSASGDLSVAFTFIFAGAPAQGETYDEARSGGACAISVTRASDNATWDAAHGIMGVTEQGSCAFAPSSLMEMRDTEALTQYVVHGTVRGTLQAKEGSPAAGSITLLATF
jgi:hypothetical protein